MITPINIDDIIRDERRKDPLKELTFKWGKEGFFALAQFYEALVCSKHGVMCDIFCDEPGEQLDPEKTVRLMGADHKLDMRLKTYKVIKRSR